MSSRLIRYGAYPGVMGSVVLALLMVLAGRLAAWPTFAIVAALGIAAVALLERKQPFEARWQVDHGDRRADAIHALVNLGLLSATAYLLHAFAAVLPNFGLWSRGWPLWVQALLAGAVLDLGLYVMHRVSHQWAWAWRLHAIHHSAQRLYWLNGERRHPLSALLMAGPGLFVAVALGVSPLAVTAWLTLLAVHLAFQHANLDYSIGPIRRWIGAAEVHRWHHKREYEDAQVNFGEFWMVWDRAFGTFLDTPGRVDADAVGLRDEVVPPNYAAQLAWPFKLQPTVAVAFENRLREGYDHMQRGDMQEAVVAFEHILGQGSTGPHVRGHVALLRWGWRARDGREILGQLTRLIGAVLFNWLWVPRGNPGSTRVNAFAAHPIPLELAHLLDRGA